jgi:hypothetical protein
MVVCPLYYGCICDGAKALLTAAHAFILPVCLGETGEGLLLKRSLTLPLQPWLCRTGAMAVSEQLTVRL